MIVIVSQLSVKYTAVGSHTRTSLEVLSSAHHDVALFRMRNEVKKSVLNWGKSLLLSFKHVLFLLPQKLWH